MDICDQIFNRTWYRFEHYVIEEGCIRPKSGAKLSEYTPTTAHSPEESNRKRPRKDKVAPYQPLLDLLNELGIQPSSRSQLPLLTEDHRAAIIRWCEAHGLFGLLPHLTHFAFLAPRYKRWSTHPQWGALYLGEEIPAPNHKYPLRPEPGEDFQGCYAVQRCYSRANGSWISTSDSLKHSFPRENAGQLLSARMQKFFPAPHVLFENLVSGSRRWASFASSWKQFFLNVPKQESETYSYPLPSGSQFWRAYREPVHAFLRAAQLLQNALEDHKKGLPRGLRTLQRLINPIGIAFEPSEGRQVEMHWRSPSLLASYAMMILLDFDRGVYFKNCEREDCGRLFATQAYRAIYCDRRCQYAVLKRGQRERNREKREAAAAALTAPLVEEKETATSKATSARKRSASTRK